MLLHGNMASSYCRFERQYDKSFSKDNIFGVDIIDIIHKRLHVFLHSCNTMDIEDIESVTLVEFSSLYKRIERGGVADDEPGLGGKAVA